MSFDTFSLPGSLTASPTKSVQGLRCDRNDDLFSECIGVFDTSSGDSVDASANPPSMQVALRVRNSDVDLTAMPVMEPVIGRPGLRMTTFTSENIPNFPGKRSRCGVFKFPDVPPSHRMEFVDETVNKLFMVYKTVIQGYGFRVKSSTFFVGHGGLWIVLTSWDSQPFNKWQKVFTGLHAEEIIIPYTGRDFPGPSRSSLASVLDAFKETSVEELGANQVFYDENEVRRCFS